MDIKIKNKKLFNIQRDIGVYLIRCKANGRIYIGSTKQNFRARFSNHCKFLKANKLSNKELRNDFNKYGASQFEFEILGVYPEHLTVTYETKFMEQLKPFYNKQKAVNNSRTNLGKKFSKEHVDKLRTKAKLFKHKDIKKIEKQNKEGASKFEITKIGTDQTKKINSTLELLTFFGSTDLRKYYNKEYDGYKITVLKTQKKSVSLLIEKEWVTFTSYEKCDKFLNKWRGFTSTQSLRKAETLNEFKVKWM